MIYLQLIKNKLNLFDYVLIKFIKHIYFNNTFILIFIDQSPFEMYNFDF